MNLPHSTSDWCHFELLTSTLTSCSIFFCTTICSSQHYLISCTRYLGVCCFMTSQHLVQYNIAAVNQSCKILLLVNNECITLNPEGPLTFSVSQNRKSNVLFFFCFESRFLRSPYLITRTLEGEQSLLNHLEIFIKKKNPFICFTTTITLDHSISFLCFLTSLKPHPKLVFIVSSNKFPCSIMVV